MKTILTLIITALSLTSCVTTHTTLSDEQKQEMIDKHRESIRQWRNSTTPEERIRTIKYNQYKTEKFMRRYR